MTSSYICIFPFPLSFLFQVSRQGLCNLARAIWDFLTLELLAPPSTSGLLSPSPAPALENKHTNRAQSLCSSKKRKKKNTKHSDKPGGSPEEVSRHARLSVSVCPSLSRSSSETARLACKTLRHVTLLPASFGSVTRTTLLDRRAQAAFKEETQFTKIRELGRFNQGTTRGCQWVAGRDSARASGCMDGGAITPLWGHTGGRGAESKSGKTLTISAHQVPLLPLGRGGHGTI